MRTLILICALLFPCASLAQPAPQPAPSPPAASGLDTNGDKKVDAAETAAATDAPGTVGDVVTDTADLVKTSTDLKKNLEGAKGNTTATMMVVTALLAAIFKLLLSLSKVVFSSFSWFQGTLGKRVVKYSTLALGGLAGLCANLAFGVAPLDALMIVASGPLAVAVHEYTKDSKPVDPPAASTSG